MGSCSCSGLAGQKPHGCLDPSRATTALLCSCAPLLSCSSAQLSTSPLPLSSAPSAAAPSVSLHCLCPSPSLLLCLALHARLGPLTAVWATPHCCAALHWTGTPRCCPST